MFTRLKKLLALDISQENLRVRGEQLNTLIVLLPAMIVSNLVLEPLVVFLMWGRLQHTALLSWLAVIYLIHAQEILHWLRSPKKIGSIEECKRWQRQFLWSFIAVGACWGSAGAIMFIPGEPVLQAFILCLMIGLASSVVASTQAFLLAQQSFVFLVITPILSCLLLQGESDYYLLSGMIVVFILFALKAGQDQSKNLELSIRHRFENAELVSNLRRVNEQLTVAQHAAQAGMWGWNVTSGQMEWSDELYLLFGLSPASAPPSLDRWRQIVHPDDLESAEAAMIHSIQNCRSVSSEYRIVLPDGQIKWILFQGEFSGSDSAEAQCLNGLCIDITAQIVAQRRAHQAESRYQTLIEQAGSALLVLDLNGHLQEVNRQACEMLGYSREELLQKTLQDFVVNFDSALAQARWKALESGAPVTFTTTHKRKDGSTFPAEVRLSSIVLDEQRVIMALVIDISERLRFETALQQSEERYRNFAERMPLGICVLQDGIIRYVNFSTSHLLGYAQEELLDKPFPQLIHEEDRAWTMDLHKRRMMGEDVSISFIVRMLRKDSTVRRWELHTSTTQWNGKTSSLVIVADITERVAMEEALRDSLRQLEEKELAKTRFLAAAGHDLRQPVAAANLFVDALKNTRPTPQQSELIAKLDQSMTVFSDLLERLLNISKFDAGQIKTQIVSFNLAELFNWLEQNFAGNAHGQGLSFRVHMPQCGPLIVRTDIGLLQSLMMNLVSNAIKYTSRGGILIAARVRGDHVLLQVWDTGCGIAENDIGKIFDEFYQVGNPQRNREAGLGLGLSICQRAMALLGGEIGCRSTLGRGSVFELSIPIDQEQLPIEHFSVQHELDSKPDKRLFKNKRVVVLEDDQLVAEGMINLLQGLGAHVLHFQNAEVALLHEGTVEADYFVVDYALERELTGAAFLRAVQSKTAKPIKGVIVTGETSSRFIEGIADLPWPVLHKPISFHQLAGALKS